jgi:hypothetical protein
MLVRPPARLVTGLLLLAAITVATSSAAAAQDDTTTSTALVRSDAESPAGNILPRPNTGQAPDSPNDPGGWQQYVVFGTIVAGLGLITLLVIRESKRARQRRSTPAG